MSLFRSIASAVYREYDRRIKRASLVTEYGAHHHAEPAHADATNEDAAAAEHEDEAEEAEIHNVPRGTPVAESKAADPQSSQKA
jgi:hypothetical protein